jgi:hypothetical protein
MANKFILVAKGHEVRKVALPRPQAPRKLRTWQMAAATMAAMHKAPYFLFRYNGCWHALRSFDAARVKTFPGHNQEAAEMWLLHQAARPD